MLCTRSVSSANLIADVCRHTHVLGTLPREHEGNLAVVLREVGIGHLHATPAAGHGSSCAGMVFARVGANENTRAVVDWIID